MSNFVRQRSEQLKTSAGELEEFKQKLTTLTLDDEKRKRRLTGATLLVAVEERIAKRSRDLEEQDARHDRACDELATLEAQRNNLDISKPSDSPEENTEAIEKLLSRFDWEQLNAFIQKGSQLLPAAVLRSMISKQAGTPPPPSSPGDGSSLYTDSYGPQPPVSKCPTSRIPRPTLRRPAAPSTPGFTGETQSTKARRFQEDC
jgi:hypothetical protein